MVQSLGISLGNANTYVAAGQGGGIEILLNEYSNRSTPSMVAFTDHCRSIGVDASSNLFMNLKNTIYDLMILVGKPYKDISSVVGDYFFTFEEGSDGQALVLVRHLGEERKFTITQVLAMLFTKLKTVSSGATDCVISCPQFFDDHQKAAVANAALVAGMNPLQIISDMSAIVLNYAYYRTTKNDAHKFIAFINFGQSNLQTVIAWLTPEEDLVRILASESESIGGRDFDKLLADHFVKEHKLHLTPKSELKLVFACEKLKKNLSANANEIPIHVESLISEDKDFTARIDRAIFEEMIQGLLQKVESCFQRTLENARSLASMVGLEFDLNTLELVGGSTRIPAIKQLAQKVFNLPPSTTLNTDEAVARGCVLHCATLHPGMKVKREVQILNSEAFFKPGSLTCDKELHRIESDLVECDKRYKARTEARNNLEEYIYSERSKLQEGDGLLTSLTNTLDWLFSDEGEDAPEQEYITRFGELKKAIIKKAISDKSTNNKGTNDIGEKKPEQESTPKVEEPDEPMDDKE